MDFSIFNKLIKNLSEYDTNEVINDTVKENDNILIDMNFQDQLYDRGIFPDGKPTGEYPESTIRYKQSPGSHDHKTDHVTLKDEGDFYERGFVKRHKKSFEIDSKDGKRDELVKREGDMFGLTTDNLQEFSEDYVLPELQEEARRKLKDV